MIFDSFSALMNMDGYGTYVWSAYAITLVVFTYNILRPVLMRKEVIKVQKRLQLQDNADQPSVNQAKGST
tara:strand:+ start:3933 stop:4142 length:210 start_codon:yes stop_codon:yes gene_type:complete